jgi:hypothetical protein
MDGLEDDFVLDGALMVVDSFATYRWVPGRSLWLPVRPHVMVVDASNHSSWDPGQDFWRALRHREEGLPDGLSACETFRACPDCDDDVGVVEGAPHRRAQRRRPPVSRREQRRRLGLVSSVRISM